MSWQDDAKVRGRIAPAGHRFLIRQAEKITKRLFEYVKTRLRSRVVLPNFRVPDAETLTSILREL